jgi:hypothetical protein
VLVFGCILKAMDKSQMIRRVRKECGEWGLEAVVRHVGSAKVARVVLEGLVRAEDELELATSSTSRVEARARLRDIRRELELELYP